MIRNGLRRIGLVTLALAAAVVMSPPARGGTNDVLGFADHLYARQDYYRAITEYERFLFLNPSNPAVPDVEFQIGLSYLNGEKPETAAPIFSAMADRYAGQAIEFRALRMAAESYARMKKYGEARGALEELQRRCPAGPGRDELDLRIAWYLLCDGEPELARARLASATGAPAARLVAETRAYEALPRKSPLLAGALSAAVPGAGQLYTGRPRDGLLAFVVNGCLIWAAVEAFDREQTFAGGLLVLLDASWYAGNVYNAVNNAHKVNRRREQDFLDSAGINCGLALFRGGEEITPGVALRSAF